MNSAPAPSSRRLKRNDVQIDVVATSSVMKAFQNEVIASVSGRRYICLAIRPDDEPELHSFCRVVAYTLKLAPPRIVNSVDGSFCRLTIKKHDQPSEGVLALRMNDFPNEMWHELLRLSRRGYRFPLFIGTAPSVQMHRCCTESWPTGVSDLFDFEAIRWPALKERQDDLPMLVSAIAEHIVSDDGRYRAEMAPDGIDAICEKNPQRVAEIIAHIRGAFDVMLRSTHAKEITAEHVRVASDPTHRRNLFKRPTTSSATD